MAEWSCSGLQSRLRRFDSGFSLQLDLGSKIMKMIPYGIHDIDDDDIQAVVDVLKSDFITQGPFTSFFERKISSYVNSKYCVALNSATSALHAACVGLGLQKGDNLWTSPISFVASANCGLYCGAEVDFIDINLDDYSISIEKLEEKLIIAKKKDCLPKIIVTVHLGGYCSSLIALRELSDQYGFKIIEDASHCIGGSYTNEQIGNCRYSDAAIFSFHPVKIITTGEGGVVTTNDKRLYEFINSFKGHGLERNLEKLESKINEPWYYEQQILGYNYRITEIQLALGLSQLNKLDNFILKRRTIAKKYFSEINNPRLILPKYENIESSSYHLFILRIKENRDNFFNYLRSNNIFCQLHYIPIYRHPFYQKFNYDIQELKNSETYYKQALSIPIHQKLSDNEINYIINCVNEFDE